MAFLVFAPITREEETFDVVGKGIVDFCWIIPDRIDMHVLSISDQIQIQKYQVNVFFLTNCWIVTIQSDSMHTSNACMHATVAIGRS